MKVFALLVLFGGLLASEALDSDLFRRNIMDFFKGSENRANILSYVPQEVEELLPYAQGLYRSLEKPFPESKLDVLCLTCITLFDSALTNYDNGAPAEDIMDGVVDICMNVGIVAEKECTWIAQSYVPEVLYLHDNGKLTADSLCGVLLGKGCGDWEAINDWTVTVDQNKPPLEVPSMPAANATTIKALHLSDVHLDLTYTLDAMGSECGTTQCCTNETVKANLTEDMAGYWGDFHCDFPLWSFNDMLTHIKETHGNDFDYIMLTGDYPAHDVWRQSREGNLAYTQSAVDEVLKVFPGTQVYPSLGNHESYPCNSFPSSEITEPSIESSWVYEGLADIYSQWLPQSALDTFSVDGFYSVEVAPGFRIIALNSMYCYIYNFWINWDLSDPVNQLQWLHDELLAAEQANERVHILSHIPTGHSDCLGGWGREFTRIINRFENTVTGQFYGHTHYDEYIVYYEEGTNRATNIAFIVPSVTTWSTLNPAYRIYTLDDETKRVINHDTYIMDIDAANAAGPGSRPEYFKLYSVPEDLGMDNVFPAEWDRLARRMAVDDDLYSQFFTYYTTGGESHDVKRDVICKLVTSSNLDDAMCIDIMGEE